MENASNALMIAAGVLIGIMLVSIIVFSFRGAAGLASTYDITIEEASVEKFNNVFIENSKKGATLQNIITMAYYAQNYNSRNEYTKDSPQYISVKIGNTDLTELIDKDFKKAEDGKKQDLVEEYLKNNDLLFDNTNADETNTDTKRQTFDCILTYQDNGLIKQVDCKKDTKKD